MTENDKIIELQEAEWVQNHHGWWHPPCCLASWPLDEAYQMLQADKAVKGL